jgi:hypothetical protein
MSRLLLIYMLVATAITLRCQHSNATVSARVLCLLFSMLRLPSHSDVLSGVMRHGLNAAYYANQNKPIRAIQEAGAAARDAITGSRK